MLEFVFTLNSPVAIRYPRGKAANFKQREIPIEFGKGEFLTKGKDGIIIAEGTMVCMAYSIYKKLKDKKIELSIVNIRFIKPLDEELLNNLVNLKAPIYTLEDNVLYGGFGSSILEHYSISKTNINIKVFAHKNGIIEHGDKENLLKLSKMDVNSVSKYIYDDIMGNRNESK